MSKLAELNASQVSILTNAVLGPVLTYRGLMKDPAKVVRSRKRGRYISAGVIGALAVTKQVVLKKGDVEAQMAAEKIEIVPMLGTYAVSLATSFAAMTLIEGRSSVSRERAAAYAGITSGVALALGVYNQRRQAKVAAAIAASPDAAAGVAANV